MALLNIEITDWSGKPRATCPVCRKHSRVAHTEAEARLLVRKHMRERHVAEVEAHREEASRLKATLYDPTGKVVTHHELPDEAAFQAFKTEIEGD